MIVRRYTIDICDPCLDLEGRECHTPGCIFFLCSMRQVANYLDRMLLRPKVLENLKGEEPYHKVMQREAQIVSQHD
jgi:hypothetical protein